MTTDALARRVYEAVAKPCCKGCGAPVKVFLSSGRVQKSCKACRAKAFRRKQYDCTCRVCGKKWQSIRNVSLCSAVCAHEARGTTAKRDKACVECGKAFRASYSSQVCCSKACAFQRSGRRLSTKAQQQVSARAMADGCLAWLQGKAGHDCRICGQWTDSAYPTGLCSDACRAEHARAYSKARNRRQHVRCRRCDELMDLELPNGGWSPRTVCEQCAREAEIASRNIATRRRKLMLKYVECEVIVPRLVFARDRWTCQLCLGPVLRNVHHLHPMAATIDHINPLSRGGSHTMGNVQCAHRMCNSYKGDEL